MAERESALEERQRHDAEKAADIKARQIRLGHIPAPVAVKEEEKKEAVTSESKKAAPRKKTETKSE